MQNVVFLMADQFRFDAAGFSGNPLVQTPHLDKFAASATVFSHAFTPTPICVAARMSLITGQRGSRTHYLDNRRLPGPEPIWPTLMTLLHEAGYWTQAVGKMHFNGRHYGFQGILSQEETPECILDDDYLLYLRENGQSSRYPHGHRDLLYYQPQKSTVALEHSPENWVAERSVQFLREHVRYRKEKPFFLFSSWIAPHPPFAACEPYASLYKPENMPMPQYADRSLDDLPPASRGHRARLDGAHRDEERMRRIKSLYYGKVTHVDDCIGRVLNELERLGLTENTIVVFMSDHGEMLGDHGLSQKNVPYEASIRIPLIVHWNGLSTPNTVRDDMVGLEDMMPTLINRLNLDYSLSTGNCPDETCLLRRRARTM
jgi:arylsulfatase A-like enzyme